MKTYFNYALLSAIAFVGATGFIACSSSDDVAETNPNYNPETNSVKTEFVINVTQPNERTRMAAADAGAGTFQGINNMKLICFAGTPGSTDHNVMSSDTKLGLTSYTGPTLDGTDPTLTNSSSKVYTLYIPTGTKNFLFYATALATVSDKFAKGSLVNNVAGATSVTTSPVAATDISFNLEPIVTTAANVTTPQGTLKAILDGIAGVSITTPEAKTWASTSGAPETYYRALGSAFDQFTNQAHSGDVRQGSSVAILNMVSDLFETVKDIYADETNATANALAKKVLDKIAEYFTVTVSGTTYTWEGSYKAGTTGAGFNTNKYPDSQDLPTGSAVITYDNTNGFVFVNDGHIGTASVSVAYNNFTYPSQLTYYCNSALWQTTTGVATSAYPTTSAQWVTATNWTAWDHSAVSSATRAVAMEDNITYGVAQLASTIKLSADAGTSGHALVDNAANVTNNVVENQQFDGTTAQKTITLKIHGMLIGGQPAVAQYDYLPQGTNIANVIYDRFSVNGTTVDNTTGVTNYTLALDNHASSGEQNVVNVALEMTADKDFYGATGKIKANQKFYLIGSLDPTAAGLTAVDWTAHKSFKTGDRGQGVDRVFIRDAKTVATFTLKENCLQKAYSTIPDLRSTQMLFGISVDLAWKTGLSFNVNIGE